MYITKQSRRDIAFAVNKLSRCTSNPNKIIALHQKECLNTYEAQLTIIYCIVDTLILFLDLHWNLN